MNFNDIGKRDQSWRDEIETRNWWDYPELSKIPKLIDYTKKKEDRSANRKEVLEYIGKVSDTFKDLSFIYEWKISLLCQEHDIAAARSTLDQGLENAKKKSAICTTFATRQFEADGDIIDSIHWWIVSAGIQLDANTFTTDDPFLYLSSVADALSERALSTRFLQLNDQINSNMLRLYPETKMKIQQRVQELPSPHVFTIRLATSRLFSHK